MHKFLPLFFALAASTLAQQWRDAGATFGLGAPGNSGQNLYLNRRGELEVIRRYDLDGNGYLDLLFNSTHDTYNALPATLAVVGPAGGLQVSELGVDGSSRVVASDLNRDGFTDLVFMPNRQNVQRQRSSVIIAWGAADGWSSARLTRQLPVNGVRSLAVGDLNGDGWPDILTLNSEGWLFDQPAGRILRVYWGGKDGFLPTRFHDLGLPQAIEVVIVAGENGQSASAAVLTETGAIHRFAADATQSNLRLRRTIQLPVAGPDATALKPQCLVVQPGDGSTGGGTLWIGTNTNIMFRVGAGAGADAVTPLQLLPATHLAFGRLDDDPWPDLVITNLKAPQPASSPSSPAVAVLWGTSTGVSSTASTALKIPGAISTAVGDLDGDGHGDLLVAVSQGEKSTLASSQLLLGSGGRRLPAVGLPVTTEGAEGVAMARLAPQSRPVAVFANSQRRTLDDAVPVRLYWGSASGFSTAAMADIPNLSGYKSSASDLNSDGHVDLILVNGGDVSEETAARAPDAGVNIYWGGSEGAIRGPGPTRFDRDSRQVLPEKHVGSINVADLNRDGFLDLVLGAFETAAKPDTDLIIYYGSPSGFHAGGRRAIPVPGRSIGCLIADFDRDGRLDIVIGSYTTNQVVVYRGSDGDYSDANKIVLPYPAPIDLEAADLNGDGWLDLLVASYRDPVALHHDFGFTIFWGGPKGWHQARAQWLPGMTPLGLAVADLDGDGFLDIVSPHYHGELSREQLPSYIFWGSATGYSPLHRTSLIVNSASEVVIADFDRDGRPDLAFAGHSTDPGHVAESPIFFNDGNRFRSPKVQYLPATGPHYMWVQDIGNIYDRRHEENFTSRVFTWAEARRGGRLAIDAATPFGSRTRSVVRSAANETGLASAPWRDVSAGVFEVGSGDRALQYRIELISANGDAYPVVRRVDISLR